MKTGAETAPLPDIPGKRYFTIGEVSDLCGVKPHVLRYWEQEFQQLHPVKRRGNRRYYQKHDILLVRRIRALLYGQGFTINGARQQLSTTGSDAQPANDAPGAFTPGATQSRKQALRDIRSELEDLLDNWPI